MGTLVLALLLSSPLSQAECPLGAQALTSELDASFEAYDAWEWDSFDARTAGLFEALSCLDAAATPEQAERIHLLSALCAAQAKDEDKAADAFEAVLAVNPSYAPSQELAPQGSLLKEAYEHAQQDADTDTTPLPAGEWTLDGAGQAQAIPRGRLSLLQWQDPTGPVRSWYLDTGPLPADLDELLTPTDQPPPPEPVAQVPDTSLPTAEIGRASGRERV